MTTETTAEAAQVGAGGARTPGPGRSLVQSIREALSPIRYFHGGAPGLRAGDLIAPRHDGDSDHLVDGCPTCDARRSGEQAESDNNDPSRIYVTTSRSYATIYAAGYPDGAVYRVEPHDPEPRLEDPEPSWSCTWATVLAVLDPLVRLTPKQTRSAIRKYRGDRP